VFNDQAIINDYNNGTPIKEIARKHYVIAKYGISKTHLSIIIKGVIS
jgi:hypothetical protein